MDKVKLITTLIGVLLKVIKPEMVNELADMILDYVELKVRKSPNKIDDITVLPLCQMIRNAFAITD